MTDLSPKQKLLIAKQQLDKLSIFIVSLSDFFSGTHPSIDLELKKIKKLLSGKPDYDLASELSVKINADLKKETKLLQQQQLNTLSQIENGLRKLKELDAIDKEVKEEISHFLSNLSTNDGQKITPISTFEKALSIFRKALSNNVVSLSAQESKQQKQLHLQIAQELKELLIPYLKKNPKDLAIIELREKLNAGLTPNELLECCLSLIRFVVKDVVSEAGSAKKLIHDIHKSLQKVNQGIKTTIEKTQTRMSKRAKQTANMKKQIDAIETALVDTDKLEDLKEQAQLYLIKLQDSLDASETEDKIEHKKMIALLLSMQKRLIELETQAQSYQQKLEDQRNQAMTDSLTSLPNRVAYEEKARNVIANAENEQSSLCMAVIDIDHFKSINDKYGHSVGDKTLQVIGKQLRGNLRQSDFVARWGGEEFVILLPTSKLEIAFKRLEQMRLKISELPFMFKGNRVSVTVSIGLVELSKGETLEQAFERADKLLYKAKENGRNQTQFKE